MKKTLAFLLTFLLMTTPIGAEKIYENKVTEHITKGVVLESTDTYTDKGWQRVDVVKIDLTDKDLQVKVLSPKDGVSSLQTVKQMAENYGTKAAVNGDFFNMISGETNMLGMVISEGELISTPSKDNFASFALDFNNSPIFGYFTFKGTVFAENTSLIDFSSHELYQINKVPVTTGGITMLTPAWGKKVDIPAENYAMVAEKISDTKYKMTASSWGGEAVPIPENGVVFSANHTLNNFLNANFAIGDIIRVEAELSPDISKIKESIGGNTIIVRDGAMCDFTSNIAGKNPRTALGVSPSGDTLYLVAVDGRKADCPGFTQEALAQLMIELGCETAINLDGGGSTTMVTEDLLTGTQKVQNNITYLRRVSNAIGVISTLSPLSSAKGGKAELSSDTIVCGDSVRVSYGFYDKNYNRISASKVNIKTTDKSAIISDDKITFNTPGEHTVSVTYQKVTAEATVKVLGDIFSISISPESADATEKDSTFTVTAYDRSGYSAPIPASLVEFTTSDSISISGNKVSKTTSTGTVSAKYKGLSANAVINGENHIREDDIAEKDTLQKRPDGAKAITFAGEIKTPENLIGMLQSRNYINSIATSDDLYCVSSVYDKWGLLKNYKLVDSFSQRTVENSKIVTFSSAASNSIRLSAPDNWTNIIDICNNTQEKNIVFVTNSPMYNLDANEKIVWNHYMNILTQKGKNVFVISPGEKSEIRTEQGVRYLYTGGIGACSIDSFNYGLNQSTPLTLYFSGDEISYWYK